MRISAAFHVLALIALLGTPAVARRSQTEPSPDPADDGGVATGRSLGLAMPAFEPAIPEDVERELQIAIERSTPSLVQVRCVVPADDRESGACCRGSDESVRSGVLVDPSGFLVTIADAMHGVQSARVRLWDGDERLARFIGFDEFTDLALFDAGPIPFSFPPLAEDASLEPGSVVVAIGNPFGAYGSVSVGYVSGVSRVLARTGGQWAYEGLLQITTPVLPGDSGGVLANRRGQVVGVLLTSLAMAPLQEEMERLRDQVRTLEDAIRDLRAPPPEAESEAGNDGRGGATTSIDARPERRETTRLLRDSTIATFASSHDVSFAWPAERVGQAVRRILGQDDAEPARRLRLGVVLDRRPVDGLGVPDDAPRGLVVLHVLPGLAAERAGIRVRDVLCRAGGIDLDDFGGLRQALGNAAATGSLRLRVLRDHEWVSLVVHWEGEFEGSEQGSEEENEEDPAGVPPGARSDSS